MWCRVLTFCVLVTIILFVVLSCLYGRPVYHLFFHRCCGDDIENDQVIFENFGNNFLRERLVGADIIEVDNSTLYEAEEVKPIIEDMKNILNIHDPESRKTVMDNKFMEDNKKEIMIVDDTAYSDIEVFATENSAI